MLNQLSLGSRRKHRRTAAAKDTCVPAAARTASTPLPLTQLNGVDVVRDDHALRLALLNQLRDVVDAVLDNNLRCHAGSTMPG